MGSMSPSAERLWTYIYRNGYVDLDDEPPDNLGLSYDDMNKAASELDKAGLADIWDGCASGVRLRPMWASNPDIYIFPQRWPWKPQPWED